MNYRLAFFMVLACAMLAGCMQLQQVHFSKNPHDVRIVPGYGNPLGVSIRPPSLERENQGRINSALSYATDARGKKYPVLAKTNDYARNYPERSYFTSDVLYLLNPSDPARVLNGWPNGEWDLRLIFDSPRGRQTMDSHFRLSNFTFILFVHRPN